MKTVLYVDDEDSIRQDIRQLFSDDVAIRLLLASSGEEALEIVRTEDVWLVVSDYQLCMRRLNATRWSESWHIVRKAPFYPLPRRSN